MTKFVNQGFSRPAFGSAGIVAPPQNGAVEQYGRVVDVILNSSHPRYKEMGESQALYGIFYQPLLERAAADFDDQENYSLRFAYCKQNSLRQIPVRSEIVKLEESLAALGVEDRGSNVDRHKIYWTEIIPVWNHPHLNIYPDTVKLAARNELVDLGPDFQENVDIKPLQLNTGDVVLEGRHGQSLRFGGTKSDYNEITSEENNGKPYTILRNGQAPAEGDVCLEDVNKDDSSIYLVSDHKIPIVEASHKFAGAVKNPPLAKDYIGKQIVVNSDQVVVNAREHNMYLAAKEHLGGNAKTVSLDGEDYLGLDADKVYLGTHAQRELNPVLKGQETVDLLNEAFGTLRNFIEVLAKLPNEPYSWVAAAKTSANVAAISLKSTLARIQSLLSKKVYTE